MPTAQCDDSMAAQSHLAPFINDLLALVMYISHGTRRREIMLEKG